MFHRNFSTALLSQQWKQEDKVMRIQKPASSQRRWGSWPTAPMVSRLWTAAGTLWWSTSVTTRVNINFFKKLDHVNNSIFEVELSKAQIEHKEPIIFGFFFLQCTIVWLLELYYYFFTKFCEVRKNQRVGNGHKFAASRFCLERNGSLYPNWNENIMGTISVKRMQWQFHCWCIRKFLPACVLWQRKIIYRRNESTHEVIFFIFLYY